MKTAQEMNEYCEVNNLGYGVMRANRLRHFKVLESLLKPDEGALITFIGTHNYKSITNHAGTFAYALTNKRLLLAQKKVVGENHQSINIDNINDITISTGLMNGIIAIDTTKELFNVQVEKGQARNIYEHLTDVIFDSRQKGQSKNDSLEEIKRFKELLDLGIISQEEFEGKRAELLGL